MNYLTGKMRSNNILPPEMSMRDAIRAKKAENEEDDFLL